MYLYYTQEDADQHEMPRTGCCTQPCAAPRLESDWNVRRDYFRVFYVFPDVEKEPETHPVDD